MSRRLPRSFFWIDQQIIRNGTWLKLNSNARLIYVAVSASVDREGLSIWSRTKLMELSGCCDPDEFQQNLVELEALRLIESIPQHVPPAIRICSLELSGAQAVLPGPSPVSRPQQTFAPIVVHTTIHVGGEPRHVESGNTN